MLLNNTNNPFGAAQTKKQPLPTQGILQINTPQAQPIQQEQGLQGAVTNMALNKGKDLVTGALSNAVSTPIASAAGKGAGAVGATGAGLLAAAPAAIGGLLVSRLLK